LLVFLVAGLAGCASKDRLPSPPPPPPVTMVAPSVAPPVVVPPPVQGAAPGRAEDAALGKIGSAAPGRTGGAAPAPKLNWMPDILFSAGSYDLSDQAKSQLNTVPKIFQKNGGILVKGHADSDNSLAIHRADAVKSYLQKIGIESHRIYASNYNNDDNKIPEGHPLHNRVEILIASSIESLSWKAQDQIPVLFATNRQRTGEDNPLKFYNNNINKEKGFQRGLAVIKVPPHHVRGKVERPDLLMVTLEKITEMEPVKSLHAPKIIAEDPTTHFSYVDKIKELKKSVFDTELAKAVKESKSKTAVLYVHGYANNFNDAVFRTAQIVHDLETPDYDLVPLMFSWPSDPGMTGMNYWEAGDFKRLDKSSTDLKEFLKEIKDNTDIGTVHIIAHSMGARVLGQALVKLNTEMGNKGSGTSIKPVFRQIIFAAPDIDVETFNKYIDPAIKSNHSITTYGGKTDVALWFSSIINGKPRTGQLSFGMVKNCMDKIDVTAVGKEGDFLKHSTWAESKHVLNDLRFVLRNGLNPLERGLKPRKNKKTWALLENDSQDNINPGPQLISDTQPALGCKQ
jgi:esterase/lipase superfamily enzyme/outer membrane protein OmpA-like peptidoglycan-associated protein